MLIICVLAIMWALFDTFIIIPWQRNKKENEEEIEAEVIRRKRIGE